jgi:hypothetical protein
MAIPGFARWRKGGALFAAVCVSGCGWWFTEDISASHVPGAPRRQLVAVGRFRPLLYGADESRSRPGLADSVTIGCENGLDLVGVKMVAPVRVAAAMAEARVAFPDPTNAASIGKGLQADAVIVGTADFHKFDTSVEVRLVRVATGAIDASVRVAGNKDLDVLGRDACKALLSPGSVPKQ